MSLSSSDSNDRSELFGMRSLRSGTNEIKMADLSCPARGGEVWETPFTKVFLPQSELRFSFQSLLPHKQCSATPFWFHRPNSMFRRPFAKSNQASVPANPHL